MIAMNMQCGSKANLFWHYLATATSEQTACTATQQHNMMYHIGSLTLLQLVVRVERSN